MGAPGLSWLTAGRQWARVEGGCTASLYIESHSGDRTITEPCVTKPQKKQAILQPLAGWVLVCLVLALMWRDYQATSIPFTIVYDGHRYHRATHQKTVEGALTEAGIRLSLHDIVEPARSSALLPETEIRVRPAHHVIVEADGSTIEHFTQRRTPREVFDELGVKFSEHDEVLVGDQKVSPNEPVLGKGTLPETSRALFGEAVPVWEQSILPPVRIVLRRAAAMCVDDDGVPNIIYTTATTVGEALRQHDFILYLGDRINPELSSRVSHGLKVYIQRSKAVELAADGRTLHTRTRGETVGDVLAQQQVALVGTDFVEPPERTPIQDGLSIKVNRVSRATIVEQETIPFETVWRPLADMEIDTQRIEQEGVAGVSKRRLYAIYHNGQEVRRYQEDEWLEASPQNRIIAYGTKIVPRQLTTAEGQFTYWRKIRMLATSYSAATSGKSPNHPRYGITFTGVPVDKGVVAVDPKVVELQSQLYVPGYGLAQAADTGGGIKGRRIDLGFSDDTLEMWYRWVDVYVLGEPPSPERIRWVLPNWPREERR